MLPDEEAEDVDVGEVGVLCLEYRCPSEPVQFWF